MDQALRLREAITPQIADHLRQAIVEMRLRPGQALSEKDIATRFGVSRQPVREAFIKLAEAGLVQILPSRGTFVVKISVREVLNARFVREAIECAVARAAAELIDARACARLSAIIVEQEEAALANDYAAFAALDEALHRAITEIVDCDYATRVVESARAQTDRVRFLSLPDASPMPVLIAQHRQIVAALIARDPEAADAAMKRHLREILTALPRLAAQHPDLFEDPTIPAHARRLIGGEC